MIATKPTSAIVHSLGKTTTCCAGLHAPELCSGAGFRETNKPPLALCQGGFFLGRYSALLEIRDSRLYRQQFPTFEAYCRERWGMVRQQANRLIQAAEVAENLEPIGSIPKTESQARPLTRLEPEVQRVKQGRGGAHTGVSRPAVASPCRIRSAAYSSQVWLARSAAMSRAVASGSLNTIQTEGGRS